MTAGLAKLKEITERHDGPILIERLYHFGSSDPVVIGEAALYALQYLEKVNQASPYIEELIRRLDALPTTVKISEFKDPQWNIKVQNIKTQRLRGASNEDLYHETEVRRTIDIAELYAYNKQYAEATNVLSTSAMGTPTCRLSEYSAQVGLLQENYANVINQEKRTEAFLTTSLSNELYFKRLTDEEVTSYWRVKYLILFAHFLKKDFGEVVSSIYRLVTAPSIQTASGNNISALQILKDSNFGNFIHEDEIKFASFLSILIHKSPKALNETLSLPSFISLMGPRLAETRPYFIALNTAKFKELGSLLDMLQSKTSHNVFFNKMWPIIRLRLRQKGYELYLKLSAKVPAEHLSNRLNIPKEQLISEIKEYIKENRLEVVFNQENEVFEVKKVDKRLEFVSKLQKLSEECDTVENLLKEKLQMTQLRAESVRAAIGGDNFPQ